MNPIAILQTIDKNAATGVQVWVNGFSTDLLPAVRIDPDRRMAGLSGEMQGYALIHPYFLRAGANELRMAYTAGAGPSPVYRVAAMDYQPDREVGTVFPDQELLRLASSAKPQQAASGTFQWTGLPDWAWTKAPPIADTAQNKASLLAAVENFWQALNGLAGQPVPAPFAQATQSSIREFVQASELRGQRFTLLDQLLDVSSRLMLPGDKTPEDFLRGLEAERQARQGEPDSEDEASPHPPVRRRADGSLPPRLALRKLSSFKGLSMTLFADGRLARLRDRQGEPVIQFISNYHDGHRGSPNPLRFSCDLWFRQNASGQWELDAVYPIETARAVFENQWPQQFFAQLPY